MSDLAIQMEGVWKKFQRGERHDSLRDLVPSITRRILHGAPQPGANVDDGIAAIRAMVAIARSVESGKRRTLAEVSGPV